MDENQPLAQLMSAVGNQPSQQWRVSEGEAQRRLDAFLAERLQEVTRREIVEWIAAGKVRVNGRTSAKGASLRPGDIVTLQTRLMLPTNPSLPVQTLWVDNDVIVVDKPSGIASTALRHDESETVANFLLAHYPEMATAGTRMLEAGIVHRLDTATSGVLLAARTPAAYTALRRQFTLQTVHKQYLALVHGHLLRSGTRRSLLTPTGSRGHRMREAADRGQVAQTTYTPLTYYPRHTLVRVTIPTGVRHQIRVHLATLGHPIVGDAVYGQTKENERLCLHAEGLSLLHPQTGAPVQFISPLPEDFQAVQRQVTTLPTRLDSQR